MSKKKKQGVLAVDRTDPDKGVEKRLGIGRKVMYRVDDLEAWMRSLRGTV